MNLYGYVKQAVELWMTKNGFDVKLRPNNSTTYTAARTLDMPAGDTDHVLVSRTSTDTLTNKTLTSPVVNTPTGIVKGDVGLGNVDNTSDTTKNAASVTLTNKTLTAPIVDQALWTEATAPSTPASGKLALYAKTDHNLYTKDSSGTEKTVATTDVALSNPMTTAGDLIKGGASGAAQRLAIGTTGQMLAVVSGSPAWQTGVLGNTGGTSATGIVGETPGATQRVGTGGDAYTVRSTTAISNVAGTIVSVTLNKGIYLASFVTTIKQAVSAFQQTDFFFMVGGTSVTLTRSWDVASSQLYTFGIPATPIVITTDSTVLAVKANIASAGSTTINLHELCVVRIA